MISLSHRLLWLLVCLAFAGCGMADSKALLPPCVSNSDCRPGEVCYEDGCANATDFAVRVNPNSRSYVTQDFNPVSVAMSRMDLTLQDPGIIEGTVQVRVGGQVVEHKEGFQLQAQGRSNVIPGLSFGQPVVQNVARNLTRFSVAVSPGLWTLRVTPTALPAMPNGESAVVPVIPPAFAERAVGSGSVVDPSLVLAGDGLTDLTGRLLVKTGEPWPASRPLFFRFQALDPISLAPLSQPMVFLGSSEFHVYTAPRSGPLRLRVAPDPKLNTDLLIPTKDFELDASSGTLGPFALGEWGSPVEVTGTVQDSTGQPIASADLSAEGRTRGGGSFTATVRTGADGRFAMKLLPSDNGDGKTTASKYTIVAYPPFGSSFSRTIVSVVVGDTALAPLVVTCPAKIALSGRVVGSLANGSTGPLAGVPVYIEGNPAAADPGPSVVRDVVTSSEGSWTTLVEPGAYRIVATPAADMPWTSRLVSAYGATTVPDITLAAGRVVAGTLSYRNKDGSQTTVSGATVTVYRQPTSSLLQPMKLYEAVTDTNGRFKVVVPRAESESPVNAGADAGVTDSGLTTADAAAPESTAAGCGSSSAGGSTSLTLGTALGLLGLTLLRRRPD